MSLRRFDLILHAVTFPLDYHRFGVVQEPIPHGAGQGAVIVEDFGPVFIGLVGRDDGRTGLIPLAENLEEQVSADFIDRQISKLVNTNYAGAHVFLEFGFEAVGGLCRRQSIDDVDGGGEQHRVTGQTALIGQRGR